MHTPTTTRTVFLDNRFNMVFYFEELSEFFPEYIMKKSTHQLKNLKL